NMQVMVGDDNYNSFIEHAAALEDGRVTAMLESTGDQVSFAKLSNGRSHASGSEIHLQPGDFTGSDKEPPLKTVYHEFGHAVDSLGMKALTGEEWAGTGVFTKRKILRKTVEIEEKVSHASGLPKYNLKQLIKDDLWKAVNGDLMSFDALGKK